LHGCISRADYATNVNPARILGSVLISTWADYEKAKPGASHDKRAHVVATPERIEAYAENKRRL